MIFIVWRRTILSEFKVGDKVKIRKDSIYYGYGENNPVDVRGTIHQYVYSSGVRLPYTVNWDNGEYNNYSSSDLEYWGHPINSISRLLYPDYIEKDGYLVPKEKYENS